MKNVFFQPEEVSIIDYKDYRKFLQEIYVLRKKLVKPYSYRLFSKELGLGSSNYLHLVIKGQRNLSEEAIRKIQKSLKWNSQEKKYFENLVKINQAKNDSEKEQFGERQESLLEKKRSLIVQDQYDYFSKWYLPVLRELVSLKNFVSNLSWISKKIRPTLTQDQILNALKTLEKLGFIRRVKGCWVQGSEHLETQKEPDSDLILNYYKEMIQLSSEALSLDPSEREYCSLTMGISATQFEMVKEKIRAFQDDIQHDLQMMNEPATQVAHLNLQFFLVTK